MAAAAHAFHLVSPLLGFVLFFACITVTCSQDVQNPQQRSRYANTYYNPRGGYGDQPPSEPGYKTYFYKDRRYGYQPSYLDPYYNRGPTRAPEDRFQYDVSVRKKAMFCLGVDDLLSCVYGTAVMCVCVSQ